MNHSTLLTPGAAALAVFIFVSNVHLITYGVDLKDKKVILETCNTVNAPSSGLNGFYFYNTYNLITYLVDQK